MSCVLCLEHSSSLPELDFIDIYSDDGLRLDIAKIINKHFWLKVQSDSNVIHFICELCWEYTRNFNKFYESIYAKHHSHTNKDEQEQVEIENSGCNKFKSTLIDAFDSEIKVEVNDLKSLPQLEIIEDITDNTFCKQTQHQTKLSHAALQREHDIFADIAIKEQLNSHRNDEIQAPRQRKRGRPRKIVELSCKYKGIDVDNTERPVRQEMADGKTSSNHPSDQSLENYQDPVTLNGNECNSNSLMDNVENESVGALSIRDDEHDDDDSDAGWLSQKNADRYAVIYKKMAVKPKKYRKHPKRSATKKRMTQAEIDARKAEQAKHDAIIQKFYEKMRCVKCQLLVRSFGDMRAHFRISHNDDHGYMVCCDRRFLTRKTLAEHVLVHWNPDHFKCPSCGKICLDARQLQTHEKTHLPEAPPSKYKKQFHCEKCPKTFSSKASFEYHSFARHVPKEEFKFECPECKKKLPTDRKLKEHLRYTHDPQCSVICDKCGKNLRNSYSLKRHNEMEHSSVPKPIPEPQQCEICGTWLRHLTGLKQHMKGMHEDTKSEHRCHICNKVSSTARALKRHIYHNHECVKKFKCTMCEKAFKRAQDLREHTSVHTGEVLYTCPNCPMTFFSNANMYKHRRRLHYAEWEADRQKPIPPNIMGQAKQDSKLRILKMINPNTSDLTGLQREINDSEQQQQTTIAEST